MFQDLICTEKPQNPVSLILPPVLLILFLKEITKLVDWA